MTSANDYMMTPMGHQYKNIQNRDVLVGVQGNKNLGYIIAQSAEMSHPGLNPGDVSIYGNTMANPFVQRKNGSQAKENTQPVRLPTPVSVLNELCDKAKVAPRFEFTEDGPVHSRRYECHVSVDSEGQGGEVKATGVGKTKKDAKQDAAKNLLLQLDSRLIEKFDSRFSNKEEISQPELDPEAPGNPVGELNEFCLRAKKIVPEYEDEGEEGQPHERVFTVVCKLGPKLVERGRGRSKKQAKRVAAYKMLQRIMVMMRNQENTEQQETDEVDASIEERLSNLSFTTTGKQNVSLADVCQMYKARSGKQLDLLRGENIYKLLKSMDPLRLLKSVVEEQNLKVEWRDLQDPAEEPKFKTLLTVGQDPMFVFFGSGESTGKSKRNAAENALQFLGLILKN